VAKYDKIDDARTNEWNGYREITDTDAAVRRNKHHFLRIAHDFHSLRAPADPQGIRPSGKII